MEAHPKVQEVKFSLDRLKRIIAQLQEECSELRGVAGGGPSDLSGSVGMAGGPGLTSGEPDSTSSDPSAPTQTQEILSDDALKLKLERLESDAAAVRKELAETTDARRL